MFTYAVSRHLFGGVEKHIRWKKVYGFGGRKYTVCDSSGKRYTTQVEELLRFLT